MLKSTLFIVALSFGFLLQADETTVQNEEELELLALTTLAGSERKAKRMHRTIERYRVYRARIDAELAKGVAEEDVSAPGMRRLFAISNLT